VGVAESEVQPQSAERCSDPEQQLSSFLGRGAVGERWTIGAHLSRSRCTPTGSEDGWGIRPSNPCRAGVEEGSDMILTSEGAEGARIEASRRSVHEGR
jgi:hypothetical protein